MRKRNDRALRTALRPLEKVALSDKDLVNLLDGRYGIGVRIVMYPDLYKARSLDEVMGPGNAAIILVESRPKYGHWIALHRGIGNDPNLVEVYNPYGNDRKGFGGWPDDPLRYVETMNPAFAKESRQDEPYLSLLMLKSGYPLSYNQYPMQKHGGDIRTCGRHCATRLLMRHLPLDEYTAWVENSASRYGLDPDGFVTLVTSEVGAPK